MSVNSGDIRQSASLELLAKQLVEGFITGLHKPLLSRILRGVRRNAFTMRDKAPNTSTGKYLPAPTGSYTKQYEEETNLRCLIVLDCSSSMFYPVDSLAKLKFSIYAASALAYLLHKQRDAIGLCLFSDKIDEFTAIKSTPEAS